MVLTKHGFTLIELLIVIAILGVLATVVLIAVNPVEQLARTRDAGRKSTVSQIGRLLQAYSAEHEGTLPTENNTWLTTMSQSGMLTSPPSDSNYSVQGVTPCTTNEESDMCYSTDGLPLPISAIIYMRLESTTEGSKCLTPGELPWQVYDTGSGRGGLVCSNIEPVYDVAGQTFVE